MAWSQLAIDKPHLAYLIIGGFTSLFMLVSLFVKEKLYIGEATVATICGVIFGPHAANLFDPSSWGNLDKITLECSRIVLVVQCFAVGVELPKAYMERHWRSVAFLLVPVMTFGWLMTSLFIWWLVPPLSWLESLACAACVTATDPVLASSVVGKGKFAKRVPKHLRDVLSAESGCNDGMAFPFIYLSIYLIRYNLDAREVVFSWSCLVVLYECIFGAIYGFTIGYIGRHAIRWADRKQLIDRESFLVFYFVLALFCAGSGSTLGIDDLLVGFSAGVGFSNDGWFTEKTEESHVSNVIDLLLNLTYFVFLGSVLPWEQYNMPDVGITPWRLSVIAILVILFRRIPIMLALKPIIPDIKTWREALFAGHFGPIGVGAIFAAILARAELESDSTEPLATIPGPGAPNYLIIKVIWPIATFLVMSSILVHGSTIAVFTLSKHINTLTLTMSYTTANDQTWMNRLPRIQSTSRSMSRSKGDFESTESLDEKLPAFPPGTLPPIGVPGNFLRQQKEEENPSRSASRASTPKPSRRRRRDSRMGAGGPVSQSAIFPQRRPDNVAGSLPESPTTAKSESPDGGGDDSMDEAEADENIGKGEGEERGDNSPQNEPTVEAYDEGDEMIIEDEEGNVLAVHDSHEETDQQRRQHITDAEKKLARETSGEHSKGKHLAHRRNEGQEVEDSIADAIGHPSHPYQNLRKRLDTWSGRSKQKETEAKPERRRGPAHAYQYGNTIIVEDEDGEVIKKYDMPQAPKKRSPPKRSQTDTEVPLSQTISRSSLKRMGTWVGISGKESLGIREEDEVQNGGDEGLGDREHKSAIVDDDDHRLRNLITSGGHRMSKAEFIAQIQALDPKARCRIVEESDVPEGVKQDARSHARAYGQKQAQQSTSTREGPATTRASRSPSPSAKDNGTRPRIQKVSSRDDRAAGPDGLTLVDSNGQDIPMHAVSDTISRYAANQSGETAAQRRRRLASATSRPTPSQSSHDSAAAAAVPLTRQPSKLAYAETEAERKRRLAALGEGVDASDDSDSDDDGRERRPKQGHSPVPEPENEQRKARGIRFADSPAISQGSVQWGKDVVNRGRRQNT